jgi:drug/metabolite transporter (DMT)-like permease
LDYGGSPAISVLLAILILRENPSRQVLLGLSISLVGVIVLISGMTSGGKTHDQSANSLLGACYAIVSALAFGFNQIVNKRLVEYGIVRDRLWLVRLPLLIVALGIYVFFDHQIPSLDALWWLFLVAWAMAGTTLPLFLLVYAFEHMRVSNVSSFLFLIPLFSFIGSLHLQHFPALQIPLYLASGLLVLVGVIVTEQRSGLPSQPASATE